MMKWKKAPFYCGILCRENTKTRAMLFIRSCILSEGLYKKGSVISYRSIRLAIHFTPKYLCAIYGTPFVSSNAADNGDNLYLCGSHSVMNVAGALTADALLGVTSEEEETVITSGYCAYNTETPTRFFTPDVPD